MAVDEALKQLRDETGVSVMQCKKALAEAGGDIEKAKVILRKQSSAIASKKSERELGAGTVAAYVHAGGSVAGVLVLLCETDFVSKGEQFKALAYDIAMHVAAMNPQFKTREDVKDADVKAAREVFEKEASVVPEKMRAKVVEGKLNAYIGERVLLEQPFVKDSTITIRGLLDSAVQKFGERVEVARFERLSVK